MKRVLISPDLGLVQHLRSALEEAGIPCFIRNERSGGLAPEIPLNDSTPQVWVARDAQLPQAQQLLAAIQAATLTQAAGPPWTCPDCGESHDSQFMSCWQCGRARA